MSNAIEIGTALALPTGTALVDLYRKPDGLAPILARIEADVRSHVADLTTDKGRKAVASLAYKVSKSKTALDDAGKELTETARAQIKAVDAERKSMRDRLDALRDEARKPLTDWEAAEELRVETHKSALGKFDVGRVDGASPTDQIRAAIAEVNAMATGPEWDEFQPIAADRKARALAHYSTILVAAEQREADAVELARLRAEAEQRARKDAEEAAKRKAEADRIAAERLAAEQAEQSRVAAERAAQREAERKAQAERDKAEAAERARAQAEAEAARREKEAAARHAREMAEAKAREEAAAQRERDRIAAERKAEAEARAKREADKAHRAEVIAKITEALAPIPREDIAAAILAGQIPYVRAVL